MGLSFSCPSGGFDSLDESLDALLKSLSIGNDYIKSSLRSVSFNGRDSELKAWGSGKLIVKGSLSFNKRDKESFHVESRESKRAAAAAVTNRSTRFAPVPEKIREPGCPKHEAAVKLQKVYKSFRTRRQLADCAVLVEQRWWKLLDFAMLRRSSVSFFDIQKTESVISKWARAKSRAAKVGKGLSKDEKARKLALQHWLEAIDPRHRYGHNLHFYYNRWLRCESKQPFFYWLDVGEGKEVSLDEKCPRSKLQYQCIKYLGPKEREVYEVVVDDGKLAYKKSGRVLDTTGDASESKWIFVLSTTKNLYVGQKRKGTFQHSSFLAGGATSAAGRLEVKDGILKAIWPHSGHYRPTEENFQEFVAYLKSKNVDLTDVKRSPVDGDEDTFSVLRPSRSEQDLGRRNGKEAEEQQASDVMSRATIKTIKRCKSFDASTDSARARVEEEEREIRKKKMMTDDSDESEEEEEEEEVDGKSDDDDQSAESKAEENGKVDSSGASKRDYRFRKPNLFGEEQEEGEEEATVPSDLILRRMNFKMGALSLQLGNQLTYRWTTGAGPRIGCVRGFPLELRFRALEQVNLSPKDGSGAPRAWPSPGSLPSPIPRASASSPLSKAHETSSLEDINPNSDDR